MAALEFGFKSTGEEVLNAFSSSIAGKTILLTGPTPAGLGASVVELLCSHPIHKPASILLLGRSLEKTQPLITKLNELSPTTRTTFITVDLASLASAREAAASVIALSPQIDILLNNAGVMAVHEFTPSGDGIEVQFAINHLGHFLLTNLLLSVTPSLFGPGARIISFSSEGHTMGPVNFPPGDITRESARAAINFGAEGQKYNEWAAYGQSKSAQILYTRSLASRLAKRDIQAFSLHPGMIFGTNLGANLVTPDWNAILTRFDDVGRQRPGVKTLEEGLSTIVVAVLDGGLAAHSGAYLNDCKVASSMPWASDEGNAEKLWETSEVLIGEKFTL